MGNPRKKPIIGIIGGIASGKSTVAAEFEKLGCAVVSADAIAHDLLNEDSVRDQVCGLFGPRILQPDGRIDRRKLAAVVFADSQKLAALNSVIHPLVFRRTEELIVKYNESAEVRAIVLDMPLLIEVGWANRCDRVIFVKCDRAKRVDRSKRRGLDEREIEIRENFQISLDKKAELADNTIDNNSDFLTLVRQIQSIFSDIADGS
ncbi:MAG TPA: dephospho-CoA kinase [Sedimentisphaerales bacterium]|nr:dephospho-CoA kinase [Phycisphaerae bacterium]HON92593.1 dephospho-CoA kinase [Sedimentisphaerales bacterium]HQG48258.1 dephospho-CoA kinase [Sedimentisphaerales bacterium]